MISKLYGLLSFILVVSFFTIGLSVEANETSGLNSKDLTAYRQAFLNIETGKTENQLVLSQISDPILLSYVEFHRLFSPKTQSTYNELTDWLNRYGDHPYAHRVWALAKKKKPKNHPDPPYPKIITHEYSADKVEKPKVNQLKSEIIISGSDGRDPLILALIEEEDQSIASQNQYKETSNQYLHTRSARSAYNNGDLKQAIEHARNLADHWVLGLSYWRLKDYHNAHNAFQLVALDQSQDVWGRSGAAYWAGRSALEIGEKDIAQKWFEMAAQYPLTFYGLLAEEKLGRAPYVKTGIIPKVSGLPNLLNASFGEAKSMSTSLRENASFRRFDALIRLNQRDDALAELRHGMKRSTNMEQKLAWQGLGQQYNLNISPITPKELVYAPENFPIPNYRPIDGARIPPALLFAIARKESRFNPKAQSYAGAYGLMQVMPTTANSVLNTSRFSYEPTALFDPTLNMKIGQLYLEKLMDIGAVRGDLFRTLAAYNAGPRPVVEAVRNIGQDSDALLMLESIPVAQTRVYVEQVVSNYWIYRHKMGLSSPSLKAAANDANLVLIKSDNE